MKKEVLPIAEGFTITNSRFFNLPARELFKFWADQRHLENWWGPAGFTNTFEEFDFTPGGKWVFVMHGPDKGHYFNECIFLRIDEPRQIIWNHISNPQFQMVISFNGSEPGKTLLTFRMVFETVEECNKLKSFAPSKNEENLDRLEAEIKRVYG